MKKIDEDRRAGRPPRGWATSAPKKSASSYARIYEVARKVPRGRVATYGQIATLAGMPRHARLVGYALRTMPEGSGVPWHRIVNASGEISRRGDPFWEAFQRERLESEGVRFTRGARVSLAQYAWNPRTPGPQARAARAPGRPASRSSCSTAGPVSARRISSASSNARSGSTPCTSSAIRSAASSRCTARSLTARASARSSSWRRIHRAGTNGRPRATSSRPAGRRTTCARSRRSRRRPNGSPIPI